MKRVPLSEIVSGVESGTSVNGDARRIAPGEVGVLKVSCVREGRFYPGEHKVVTGPDRERLTIAPHPGDLLVTRANTPDLVGECGIVDSPCDGLFLPDKVWRLILRTPDHDDPRFLALLLGTDAVRKRLRESATGTSGGMKNISQEAFLRIQVPRVPPALQLLVGRIATQIDTYRAQTEDLIAAKRRVKHALGQRSAKAELPTTHPSVRLSEVAREFAHPNREGLGSDKVMGVLKGEGLVPMRQRLIGCTLERYQVVQPGAFAYNPMRINVGSIAYSWFKHPVLVSPDYVVFECDTSKLSPRYLDHVRTTPAWARFVARAGAGSVRTRIHFDQLGAFTFRLPPLEVQHRIAHALDLVDAEIKQLESLADAYRRLKRALLQKLMRGELALAQD